MTQSDLTWHDRMRDHTEERYAERALSLSGYRQGEKYDRLAERGEIVGITKNGRVAYPFFQLNAYGRPHPVIKEVIRIMREHDASDRYIIKWMAGPNGWFDDRSAAQSFGKVPDEVIVEAAEGHWG